MSSTLSNIFWSASVSADAYAKTSALHNSSASYGASKQGLYEPIHGTAPDIAGQGIANPIGAILSAALLLRHSFEMEIEAQEIEQAVENVIEKGYRTADIAQTGKKTVDTKEMGKLISIELRGLRSKPVLTPNSLGLSLSEVCY